MGFGDIGGFGSMLASFVDTAVSSSDRRSANELNYWSTMDTNRTNADINDAQLAAARENWKREQQNFELQRKWAIQDRDYENFYNSPINVRNRLLQAGINPALAMSNQGGFASASSASAKPSQAPSFGSPPSSIPMLPAHFEPTLPNGLGLSDALARSIELMQRSERNQTDISAIRQRVANETAETKAKITSMGAKDKETEKIIEKLNQDILFNNDSYQDRMRNIQLGNDLLRKDIEKADFDMKLQQAVSESAIGLNAAQKAEIGARMKVYFQEIANMKNSAELSQKEVAQRIISMINQDAALFENVGISREMMTSQKFKNYVGTVVDAVGTAFATYMGVRRGSISTPMAPESYTDRLNGYSPWSH